MKRGFTLIELLVVIAIIAILAAILFPVFAQAREKARAISCVSNESQITLAVIQYVQDADEAFPGQAIADGTTNFDFDQTWITQVQPYIKNFNCFKCPDDAHTINTTFNTGPVTTYVTNSAMGYDWKFANNWVLEGVINPGFNWMQGNSDAQMIVRKDSDLTFPSDTILLTEITTFPLTDTNLNPNPPQGAFSPYSIVDSGVGQNVANHGIPGMTESGCGAPDGNPGLVSTIHQGRANFAFTDGHVKSLIPQSTVVQANTQSSNCNASVTGNNFFHEWGATRATD
jgi:prepilin-type N-terminal cleavage/methylation domain-containing protein/prepilin-type processing-associated H-X9-DG protein